MKGEMAMGKKIVDRKYECGIEMKHINEIRSSVKEMFSCIAAELERHGTVDYSNLKVGVAVSGGIDSITLLNLMADPEWLFPCLENDECLLKFNIRKDNLFAIHVNHQLRESSEIDEVIVSDACEQLGIKLLTYSPASLNMEIPANASEDWARALRIKAYHTAAVEHDINVILTAHTLSDKVETTIFRMTRGTTPRHIGGIATVSNPTIQFNCTRNTEGDDTSSGNDNGNAGSVVTIARPFLKLTRRQIEQLYKVYKIPEHAEDETNQTDLYTRNKIRRHVIPVLKGINLNAEQTIEQLTSRIEAQALLIEDSISACLLAAKERCDYTLYNGAVYMKYHTEVLVELIARRFPNMLRKDIPVHVLRKLYHEVAYNIADQILPNDFAGANKSDRELIIKHTMRALSIMLPNSELRDKVCGYTNKGTKTFYKDLLNASIAITEDAIFTVDYMASDELLLSQSENVQFIEYPSEGYNTALHTLLNSRTKISDINGITARSNTSSNDEIDLIDGEFLDIIDYNNMKLKGALDALAHHMYMSSASLEQIDKLIHAESSNDFIYTLLNSPRDLCSRIADRVIGVLPKLDTEYRWSTATYYEKFETSLGGGKSKTVKQALDSELSNVCSLDWAFCPCLRDNETNEIVWLYGVGFSDNYAFSYDNLKDAKYVAIEVYPIN